MAPAPSTVIKLKRSETLNTIPTTSDIEVGEVAVNTADKKIYIRDSSNNIVAVADKNISYSKYNSNTTITSNTGVIADTSAGSFTITLPASPVTGDKIEIVDGSGTFGTNPLTVARNGNEIADIADDLSLNITGVAATFIYNTDTWEVYAQIGANSGGSVTLSGSQTFTNKTISGSSNTLSNIGNSSLTNSSITIVDDSSTASTISLGETLKIAGGSGVDTTISGDTITISLENTVVTETSSDVLTNKTISGSSNTLSNIGNPALTNSTISGISLGSNLAALTIGTGLTGTSYNGSTGVTIAVDKGPAFSAYPATSQTVSSGGTQSKILFGTEEFDTANCFSSSSFTPNVAGYYQINSTVRFDGGGPGTGECMIVIWKNGSEAKRGWNSAGTSFANDFFSMSVSGLIYLNGSTDYVEIYAQQVSGGNRTTSPYANISFFQGFLARLA